MESDPFGIDDSDDEWIDELKDVIAADDAQSEPEAVPRKT